MNVKLTVAILIIAMITCSSLFAQVTIQQPAIGTFGVATTVVVPDRGSAFLGGVGGALESSKSFGPFQRGSSIGRDVFHRGASTSVFIHDFEAMDRYLLGQADGDNTDLRSLTGQAAGAYGLLRKLPATNDVLVDTPGDDERKALPSDRATFYLGKAKAAEERGATAVAKMHYRMAAKHGSQIATAKLKELTAQKVAGGK